MIPHELALVKRLEKEPFALIGVNTDYALPQTRESMDRFGIKWRNIWEGQVKPGRGALSQQWRIRGYPTVYLIDGRGVIRQVTNGPDFEGTIDSLLAELRGGAANR
jgi:hypothetical protein